MCCINRLNPPSRAVPPFAPALLIVVKVWAELLV